MLKIMWCQEAATGPSSQSLLASYFTPGEMLALAADKSIPFIIVIAATACKSGVNTIPMQVRHGHHVIARVQRKSLMKDMVRFFTGNDNYTLTVAPNVDTAFMVALAVAFDTMFHVDPK